MRDKPLAASYRLHPRRKVGVSWGKSGEAGGKEKRAKLRAMAQSEAGEGPLADMDGEHLAEKAGAMGEGAEGAVAQGGEAIEEEHEAGHALRQGDDVGVAVLVEVEAAGGEGVGEQEGLAEAHGEAFAGDGVGGAGGVTDEGDVGAGDAMEAAGEGEGAALGGGEGGAGQPGLQGGEGSEDLGEANAGMAGDAGHADFLLADGGDVGLAEGAPVDFDIRAPRSDAEMGAEAEAAAALGGGVEAGPGADAGGIAVGSDEPAVGAGAAGNVCRLL